MKMFVRFAVLAALLAPSAALAQFASPTDNPGGPVALGQVMAQPDPANPAKVTILQAPAVPEQSGGLIQLKAFGWLEPYVDTLVQLLIAAGLSWFAKSRYSAYLDDSSRAALETFLKNRASSLIADGFVSMDGKTVSVHSAALANEVSIANDRIPDAMKRFGLTPAVIAQKIVDAIPQVAAGAAIVASAHTGSFTAGDTSISGNIDNIKAEAAKTNGLPPTAEAST